MSYDALHRVPLDWLEQRLESLVLVHNKIVDYFWIKWEGGYIWRFSVQSPGREWRRPTLVDTIERQAMFEGVHKTIKLENGRKYRR